MPSTTVTVGATPTLLTPPKGITRRSWITLELRKANSDADVFVGIGDPDVTPQTGKLLRRGWGMTLENELVSRPAKEAIYAVTATGTAIVVVSEGS